MAQRETAGHDGREGELESHEAGGVIHEALAVEHGREPRGHAEPFGDGVHRHRVRRGNDRAERKGHRKRQAGHEPPRHEPDGHGGEDHEPDGKREDGAPGADKLAQRHQPAVGKQQGRQEAEKEKSRVECEPRKHGQQRGTGAAEQVGDQLRPWQPAPDHAQAGDQQEQDQRVFECLHARRRYGFSPGRRAGLPSAISEMTGDAGRHTSRPARPTGIRPVGRQFTG